MIWIAFFCLVAQAMADTVYALSAKPTPTVNRYIYAIAGVLAAIGAYAVASQGNLF